MKCSLWSCLRCVGLQMMLRVKIPHFDMLPSAKYSKKKVGNVV